MGPAPKRHRRARRAEARSDAPARGTPAQLRPILLAALLLLLVGGALAAWWFRDRANSGPGASPAVAGDDGGAAFEAARQHAVQLQESGADQKQVLDALLVAWELNPQHYGINRRLGELCGDLKLNQQALQHFEAAYRAKPEDHKTLLTIVTLQVHLGRLDEALASLPGLESDREYAGEARYQRATILDERGQRDEALALVSDTTGLSPAQAYRLQSLHGRFLLESGDQAASQAHFRAALAGRPDYKEALKGMADACRRLGQDDEASRWDRVLAQFVELTDNIYMKSPHERGKRRALLEALLAGYPEWTEGFAELAELQSELGDDAAACRTIEAYLAAHGSETSADVAAKLRARYCGKAQVPR